ncbi:beta-ketoacyl-[acyl-carrier-protein] synthase family protein [Paenibacillus sp. KS-LC4]|uniref:beta-ketoacyl-[acyl-carrier-protein] synthase family protein n=1 Tax=Paenibacillus sp. KS-LC4 TaxID=2979727 RepID=UPI0030CF3CDE
MKAIDISGMSAVTCLGNDLSDIWQQVCEGSSGLRPITLFDTSKSRSSIGGEVSSEPVAQGYDRMLAFSVQAIQSAMINANIDCDYVHSVRAALIIGTSLGHIFDNESGPVVLDDFVEELKIKLGLNIAVLTVSTACSSGTDAIANGGDFIEFLNYDLVICGGVDVLDLYKLMGHSSLHTLSPNKCKPFDQHNDGTSLGEGAAFIILENREALKERGGRRIAELVGRSSTTDTKSVTSPDESGGGAIRAISQALGQSKSGPESVSYVNAHGSATPVNDAMEARVYQELFQTRAIPISSTKAAFGHTLGATGAIEAVIAIFALVHEQAPPTANTTKLHEDWSAANVVFSNQPQPIEKPETAVTVTYGFGGANACLVFLK